MVIGMRSILRFPPKKFANIFRFAKIGCEFDGVEYLNVILDDGDIGRGEVFSPGTQMTISLERP